SPRFFTLPGSIPRSPTNSWSCSFRARGYCEDRNKDLRDAAIAARDADIDRAERILDQTKSVNAAGTGFDYSRSVAEQQAVQIGTSNLRGECRGLPSGSYTLDGYRNSFDWQLAANKID